MSIGNTFVCFQADFDPRQRNNATCPRRFAEAGAIADEGQRRIFVPENFILEHAGDRDLGGADQKGIFVLDGEPQHDTVLEHGELITAVDLPPLPSASRSHYRKVRDRASYAFALVSVAAALDVVGGMVRDVRIALGGVAPVPWRAVRAEAALRGALTTEEAFSRAAEAELGAAQPLPGNAFKIPLARNVPVRTLLDLTTEEGEKR